MANRTRDTANLVSDNNLYVNITTDKVGIGTTNPTSKLHVVGDINIDDGGTFQTVLQVITPTANRVISLPNRTGTVGLVAGSSSQLTYNLLGNQEGAVGLTYNNTQQTFTVTGLTTTTNTPVLNITQTWNNVSTTFTGVLINITDTTSAAGSLLQDWQVGGASRFEFVKTGLSYYYNTSTDVTNYERAKFGWESNVLRIGTEKLGTGVARALELQTDGTTRATITSTGNIGISTTLPIQLVQVGSGSSSVVVTSSGNLGIGTTNPLTKLDVRGDVSIASTLGIGTIIDIVPYDTLNSGTLSWEGSAGQLFSITNNLTTGSIYSVNDVSGIPSIDVDANGTIQLGPYNGNVGLGTTNPTSKLTVQGDVRVSGASTFGGVVELDSSLRDFYGTVGAAGSVLISTGAGVSWSASTPSAAAVTISEDNITSTPRYPIFEDITSGTVQTLNVSPSKLQFIPSSGTLSATVFTSLSDRTQKEDIRPIENAIEIVNQLTGVRYNWKNNTNKPSIGLIAQDVEEVIPEVVVEMADGLKSVSYGNIVAVLIEAIKEQQVRIEELEDRLNA